VVGEAAAVDGDLEAAAGATHRERAHEEREGEERQETMADRTAHDWRVPARPKGCTSPSIWWSQSAGWL
jgi:hypothetical protein